MLPRGSVKRETTSVYLRIWNKREKVRKTRDGEKYERAGAKPSSDQLVGCRTGEERKRPTCRTVSGDLTLIYKLHRTNGPKMTRRTWKNCKCRWGVCKLRPSKRPCLNVLLSTSFFQDLPMPPKQTVIKFICGSRCGRCG